MTSVPGNPQCFRVCGVLHYAGLVHGRGIESGRDEMETQKPRDMVATMTKRTGDALVFGATFSRQHKSVITRGTSRGAGSNGVLIRMTEHYAWWTCVTLQTKRSALISQMQS